MLSLAVKMRIQFDFPRVLTGLALFFVIALIASAPFPALYRWIFEGDALVVDSFFIVETEHIKPSELREYLKDYVGKPLYGVDLKQIAQRVERHPWVSSVSLRRAPPHEIVIDPTERKPIALAKVLGALVLIDEQGIPFQVATSSDEEKWPIVKSKSNRKIYLSVAADALKCYNASSQIAGKISEIQIDDSDSLHAIFANGLHAELGNDKFKEKWQKLDTILNIHRGAAERLAFIYLGDYPNPSQVAVKFRMDNESRGYNNGSIETR